MALSHRTLGRCQWGFRIRYHSLARTRTMVGLCCWRRREQPATLLLGCQWRSLVQLRRVVDHLLPYTPTPKRLHKPRPLGNHPARPHSSPDTVHPLWDNRHRPVPAWHIEHYSGTAPPLFGRRECNSPASIHQWWDNMLRSIQKHYRRYFVRTRIGGCQEK